MIVAPEPTECFFDRANSDLDQGRELGVNKNHFGNRNNPRGAWWCIGKMPIIFALLMAFESLLWFFIVNLVSARFLIRPMRVT